MAKATRGNGKEGPRTATKAPQTARRPPPKPKPKTKTKPDGASTAVAEQQFEHQPVDEAARRAPAGPKAELSGDQRVLLGDLFAVIQEHADDAAEPVDTEAVEHAFVFACERHADQRRASGEDFIVHPVGVAKICAGMRLDTSTLCAALLHDTVEDTSASLVEVRDEFGEEIAALVDGVTKLTGITFQSRDDRQAENYRKMIVAMASDIRVVLPDVRGHRHDHL